LKTRQNIHLSRKKSFSGLIFDGDDTLWETMPFYNQTKTVFYAEMGKMGFEKKEVMKAFEKIDVDNTKIMGFSKGRFPRSMQETYELFCKIYKKPFNKRASLKMSNIGKKVFSEKSTLIDGVKEVLAILRKSNFQLILATKGDLLIQKKRIADAKISKYFNKIYIFPQKTSAELYQVVEESNLDLYTSWSIGNSIKSDINPALRIGLKAIWIPYPTWHYEEDEVLIKENNIYHVASIKEIPVILGIAD
jgi:putative hydrolase of the HAD superfamily